MVPILLGERCQIYGDFTSNPRLFTRIFGQTEVIRDDPDLWCALQASIQGVYQLYFSKAQTLHFVPRSWPLVRFTWHNREGSWEVLRSKSQIEYMPKLIFSHRLELWPLFSNLTCYIPDFYMAVVAWEFMVELSVYICLMLVRVYNYENCYALEFMR